MVQRPSNFSRRNSPNSIGVACVPCSLTAPLAFPDFPFTLFLPVHVFALLTPLGVSFPGTCLQEGR